ncbi:hypothetical protein AMAG_05957 [Allomyces macrogynus ATCC 38327]|uniref:Uncharacterized protein n=1 Tax=Allomyces macrogynus (strain ATCC 38327) TaxID=578462 RepID=A0A0L0SDR8_ALLM3|nr:hypothetical protein AMAG_05957 [Allomyces macrogynus ATCC 38327]|eukprot:KNE60577.1 hypothetical protein AMAG_05957 [Allomyces macrogynus ATCC 38327]
MTSSTRAMFLAALAVVLSAATLTAAAATPTTAAASASATVTPSGGSGTFAVTITDQAYSADSDAKYLGVLASGAAAPSTIAKVQVEAKNLAKDLLGNSGLGYSIRDSCTASAAWDAQGRKTPATSGSDWSAYATGDLAGKYGPLSATKSVSNGNFFGDAEPGQQ